MKAKRFSIQLTVFLATLALWLAFCVLHLINLIHTAASAPFGTIDDYARPASFQVINFTIGSLPILLVLLFVVIGAEWLLFRMARSFHFTKKQ